MATPTATALQGHQRAGRPANCDPRRPGQMRRAELACPQADSLVIEKAARKAAAAWLVSLSYKPRSRES